MMSVNDELVSAFKTYIEENEKFSTKGVKAAAPRARKALRDIISLAQKRRMEIREEKKDLSIGD